jgi:hypothetical protein
LLVSLTFLLGANSFAQLHLSLWGGLNNSSFGGNPPENAEYGEIYGLATGLSLEYQTTKDFVISLEPSFEQRGSKIKFKIEEALEDTTLEMQIKQNYFGLALLFKINAGNFFVGSGVSFQLLSSAKLELKSQQSDIKDEFFNYDALAFFNIGYKIPIGGPALFVEVRYIQGLINIRPDESESETEIYFSNFKSTGLRLSTGIIIPL